MAIALILLSSIAKATILPKLDPCAKPIRVIREILFIAVS